MKAVKRVETRFYFIKITNRKISELEKVAYDSFRFFETEYSKILPKQEIFIKSNLNFEDSFVDNSYNS